LTEESPFSNSEDSMKTHRSVEFFQNYSWCFPIWISMFFIFVTLILVLLLK
jgi:hypothetical protein